MNNNEHFAGFHHETLVGGNRRMCGFWALMGRSVEDLPARSETGWVSVFDGRNPDNRTWIGGANWTLTLTGGVD